MQRAFRFGPIQVSQWMRRLLDHVQPDPRCTTSPRAQWEALQPP